MEDLGVDGKIILKRILKKCNGKSRICLRIGESGRGVGRGEVKIQLT